MIGDRAADLIASLGLAPHPEGGYFREVYRSASRVQPVVQRPERAALTTIYFLLVAEEVSRWHRVASDEVWHYYEGDALELVTADSTFEHTTRTILSKVNVVAGFPPPLAAEFDASSGETRRSLAEGGRRPNPVHVVVANDWQAARTLGAYTLLGCTVAPGFEYEDFEMLRDRPLDAETLRRRHPDLARLI